MPSVPVGERLKIAYAPYLLPAPADIYEDDIVIACLSLLSKLVAGGGWLLSPPPPEGSQPMQLAKRIFGHPAFLPAQNHLLQAYLSGLALVEIIWGPDYLPEDFRPIGLREAMIRADEYGRIQYFEIHSAAGIQSLPLERALYLIYQPVLGHSPSGLASKIQPLVEARKILRDSIKAYAEKHAIPPILGIYPHTLSDAEVDGFFSALQRLRESKIMALPQLPDGQPQVQFLEPKPGSIEFALEAYRQFGYDIARIILGPILSIFEAYFGTRAQAEVHKDLLLQSIKSFQGFLEDSVNRLWDLVQRIHFGKAESRWLLAEPPTMKDSAWLQYLPDLLSMGLISSQDFPALRERLNLPPSG